MLSIIPLQLKALVDNGLVERKQYESIPPKVEYSLTEIGKKVSSSNRCLTKLGIRIY